MVGHLSLGNNSSVKHCGKVSSDKVALKQRPVLKVSQFMEKEGERRGKVLEVTTLIVIIVPSSNNGWKADAETPTAKNWAEPLESR